MKEVKITCDYCKEDITTTGPYPKYRLELKAERIPHDSGGIVYDVLVDPPIDKPMHFCSLSCLKDWI